MLRNDNSKDRKLSLQSLERRELMAGDVGVQLVDGVLNINGDFSGNTVQVNQMGDGEYSVSGLYSSGASTRLNGGYNTLNFSGVTDFNVNMGSGNDRLYLNGNYMHFLEGDVNVQMGYHDDEIYMQHFLIEGDANIATDFADNSWNGPSQGDDLLRATNIVTYGKLDVNTSEGADSVEILSVHDQWNAFHNGLSINTGTDTYAGDDVELDHVFSWQGIDVDMSDGNDTFHGREIASYHDDVTIDTHKGADDVTVVDSNMDWRYTTHNTSLKINTGSGNDDVVVQNVEVRGDVRVTTSSGHDDVFMHNVHAKDDIYAHLGSGNDELALKSSSADIAYLYGGSSYRTGDKLTQHDNDIDIVIKSGWEWQNN